MPDYLDRVFSSPGFMPHGMCFQWRPDILTLHVIADSLIALAYFSIPFTLLYFVRRRKDLQFNWMFVCFAVFIVACGATHIMEIWTVWEPVYWLSGGGQSGHRPGLGPHCSSARPAGADGAAPAESCCTAACQ